MQGIVHVVTNEKYRDRRKSPDAWKKLQEVEAIATQARRTVQYIWLQFRPDQNTDALASIVEQTRDALREIEPGSSLITIMGDGGTGTWLRAKQEIDGQQPERSIDRVCVLPGGTMNLIAKALGVSLRDVRLFLDGDPRAQDIVVRELIIKRLKGDDISFPWVAFSGVGLDARILEPYDSKPRSNHVLTNVALASLELAPEVIFSSDRFVWDMAFAVSQLGLMKFDPRQYDRLESRDFNRVQLGPVGGVDAALQALMLQVAGIHPMISNFYWQDDSIAKRLDRLPGHAQWRSLLEKIKPAISNGQKPHRFDGDFTFHLDGYPHRLPPGVTDYSFASVNKLPVRVFSASKCRA